MNYLLDTCVISDFFKKDENTIRNFENLSPNQIYISTISIMEVEYGLKLKEDREKKIRPLWISLLKQIKMLSYTHECSKATASIRAFLKNIGMPIGPYDALIAGTALSHDLIVVTSNMSEFKRVPEIKIENWRE